jgi:single stranded DNA-binding protein
MEASRTLSPCGTAQTLPLRLADSSPQASCGPSPQKTLLGTWEFTAPHVRSGSMSRFTRDQKENIMSSYKNNVHLEGNLGKDAEKKSTPNGDVVNFSIAVPTFPSTVSGNRKDGTEHKNTDWFQIQVWGPLAKFAATIKVGTPIIVEGKIKPETYTADDVEHKTFSIKADYIRKIDYSAPNEASDTKAAKPAKRAK